jgi:hypothetical protein
VDEYEKAKSRLSIASKAFKDAESALEVAEVELNAAIANLEAMEGQSLPTAADVRGIFRRYGCNNT